ncbi:hypothetical protein FNV43_RR13487 [Rhamnella rubrinervis]|uniref:Uncharacterized protein n=1 Tax=Rhamnella rubrinervis TaxID=2594499 RepID=A0A8K0MFA6_9ROSA|nr:hypothetical protein FNV43_RR13487 [Rhamnella rubrinervis]
MATVEIRCEDSSSLSFSESFWSASDHFFSASSARALASIAACLNSRMSASRILLYLGASVGFMADVLEGMLFEYLSWSLSNPRLERSGLSRRIEELSSKPRLRWGEALPPLWLED